MKIVIPEWIRIRTSYYRLDGHAGEIPRMFIHHYGYNLLWSVDQFSWHYIRTQRIQLHLRCQAWVSEISND